MVTCVFVHTIDNIVVISNLSCAELGTGGYYR